MSVSRTAVFFPLDFTRCILLAPSSFTRSPSASRRVYVPHSHEVKMPLQRGFPSDVVPRAGRGAKIGRVELHVLCSGTWDAAPSLLLTVERKETHGYLINCGEGTMRFCAEHHMRLTPHLTRVLFTRQTWEAIGGLPDVLLTRFAEREK